MLDLDPRSDLAMHVAVLKRQMERKPPKPRGLDDLSFKVTNRRTGLNQKISHVQIDPIGIMEICKALAAQGVRGDRVVRDLYVGATGANLQGRSYQQRHDLEHVLKIVAEKLPDLKLPVLEPIEEEAPDPAAMFDDSE